MRTILSCPAVASAPRAPRITRSDASTKCSVLTLTTHSTPRPCRPGATVHVSALGTEWRKCRAMGVVLRPAACATAASSNRTPRSR
eukprot:2260161-Rhodomonas_salina.1